MVATEAEQFEKRIYEVVDELVEDLRGSVQLRNIAKYVATLERELSQSASRELELGQLRRLDEALEDDEERERERDLLHWGV